MLRLHHDPLLCFKNQKHIDLWLKYSENSMIAMDGAEFQNDHNLSEKFLSHRTWHQALQLTRSPFTVIPF